MYHLVQQVPSYTIRFRYQLSLETITVEGSFIDSINPYATVQDLKHHILAKLQDTHANISIPLSSSIDLFAPYKIEPVDMFGNPLSVAQTIPNMSLCNVFVVPTPFPGLEKTAQPDPNPILNENQMDDSVIDNSDYYFQDNQIIQSTPESSQIAADPYRDNSYIDDDSVRPPDQSYTECLCPPSNSSRPGRTYLNNEYQADPLPNDTVSYGYECQILSEMGYIDIDKNLQLLQENSGNLEQVIERLIADDS